MAKLALEHGLNTNLVFRWRRQYRAGHFGPVGAAPVAGVKLLPVVNAKVAPAVGPMQASSPVIEIVMPGTTVRLCNGVDAQALTRVLDCLAHRA